MKNELKKVLSARINGSWQNLAIVLRYRAKDLPSARSKQEFLGIDIIQGISGNSFKEALNKKRIEKGAVYAEKLISAKSRNLP